jgi:DNA-binding CsgD family transcriptional regulator
MPIQSVVLFLVAVLASAFLLGISFTLRSKYNARYLDHYFYFVLVVVSYGFVNWLAPSFAIHFAELGADQSSNAAIVFAAVAVPLALLKLFLFALLLLRITRQPISKLLRRIFFVTALLSTVVLGILLSRDYGGSDLAVSGDFLTLFGVLVVAANFIVIFLYLSKVNVIGNEVARTHAQAFGWAYLVSYFVYTSPYYLAYFVELQWYLDASPYIYYAMHLVPIVFLWQFSSVSAPEPEKLETLVSTYGISSREREILVLILAGKNNNEIADQLCISPNTVRNHVYNIYGKLHVKNRIQLKTLCDG